ncbi:hypothetical protein NDU88_005448 [Pleurodeles waltl]|uniref:Uncharacterized protein n=1 Tax=Pleurodeles waltl TaxID=8319 RepID=A0AAV7N078_PLEWA|nr:hypothetical protein NDU88_005448 [Pleurodeles waltl]
MAPFITDLISPEDIHYLVEGAAVLQCQRESGPGKDIADALQIQLHSGLGLQLEYDLAGGSSEDTTFQDVLTLTVSLSAAHLGCRTGFHHREASQSSVRYASLPALMLSP